MIVLSLPWPPSVNRAWRHPSSGPLAGRHLLSADGRAYRADAHAEVLRQLGHYPRLSERLSVTIAANPPDKRRRDLDNLCKSTLDALQHAGVYADDSQIDELHIIRDVPLENGRIVVTIREMPEHT